MTAKKIEKNQQDSIQKTAARIIESDSQNVQKVLEYKDSSP